MTGVAASPPMAPGGRGRLGAVAHGARGTPCTNMPGRHRSVGPTDLSVYTVGGVGEMQVEVTTTSGCIVGPSARAATCHDIQTRSPWRFSWALSCSDAWMRSRPTSAWNGPKPSTRLSCTGSSRKSARLSSETECSGCVRGRRPTCAPREDTAGQPFAVFPRTVMSGRSPSCLRSQGCPTDC